MSDAEPSSDLELIQKSKRGDSTAFGQLVRRYQKRVYALCFRLSGSHDIADDLTQEAFIKAYEAIESFDESYPFYSWISRIATNNAINFIKRQKRSVGGEEGEIAIEKEASSGSGSNPEMVLNQKEIDRRYLAALENLSEEFRVVFVLRMHEDLSYEEIAAQLKLSPGTVMSRLHRARQKLMDELKDILEK